MKVGFEMAHLNYFALVASDMILQRAINQDSRLRLKPLVAFAQLK